MPDVKKRLAELGAEPGTVFGDTFGQFMTEETAKWGKLVKASGATVD
ncbi:tripartite-type tricarboxylate transporter receptor subunit TctC [Bradyrhizobium sp. S3.14.4]